MSLMRGVDVHPTYQNVTSWAEVYKAGIRFSIQKASENKTYPSGYFKGAKAAGLLVGAYHWLHPNKSISAQVEMFAGWLRAVGWRSGRDLPPALDLEDSDGLADSVVRIRAHQFLDLLDRELGLTNVSGWRQTMVYMNADWRRRMVDVHHGRVLWLASWPSEFRNKWPTQDGDKAAGAGIHQFVGGEQTNLRVKGIASPCDLNVALRADLERMAPEFFGQTGEENMDLTAQNLKDIAAAVWGAGLDPGEFAERVGPYQPNKTYSAGGLMFGADSGWKTRQAFADAFAKLPSTMVAAVGQALAEEGIDLPPEQIEVLARRSADLTTENLIGHVVKDVPGQTGEQQ